MSQPFYTISWAELGFRQVVIEVEKLSVAERNRGFYAIDFSPDRLEIACRTSRISDSQKTCDMSDDPQLPLLVSVSPSSAKLKTCVFGYQDNQNNDKKFVHIS